MSFGTSIFRAVLFNHGLLEFNSSDNYLQITLKTWASTGESKRGHAPPHP